MLHFWGCFKLISIFEIRLTNHNYYWGSKNFQYNTYPTQYRYYTMKKHILGTIGMHNNQVNATVLQNRYISAHIQHQYHRFVSERKNESSVQRNRKQLTGLSWVEQVQYVLINAWRGHKIIINSTQKGRIREVQRL